MAMAVMQTIIVRAGVPMPEALRPLHMADGTEILVSMTERPPLASLTDYQDRHAR